MIAIKTFQCPCCKHYTLINQPPGSFEICPVCFWEDDNIQYFDPNYEGGANDLSLNQARENYKKMGAMSQEHQESVRPPLEDEK